MSDSLKNKTVKGLSWSFVDNIANSGITFLVGLVLARLLSPQEYGVMAIVAIFIAVSNSIVDSGFSNALIRKREVKSIDYNTVFYFNLLISFALYIIFFLSAPFISNFFHEPILIGVVRVMGLVLIINAFVIIPRTNFVRNVDFKIQTKASLISSLISGTIGIGMAVADYGVWSLVGQQLSRQFFNALLLWLYCRWRPIWEFSKKSFQELFSFGSKLLVSGLIDTIYKNVYYLVIGRFYTSHQLGQYTRAEQFSAIFSSNLTAVVQRVSYPVLSSIQSEDERLKEAYRRVIKTTMLISFACMLGLAAVAKPLILMLIGEKWLQAVYYLQIICFAGMLYPLHAINLNILQVKGRSDLFLKLEIIKKSIAIFPIVVGVFWGIGYMLCGSVLTSFIAFFLNSYYSSDLIAYPTVRQIKDILPSFFVSLIVASIMWSFSFLPFPNLVILILQIVIGLILAWLIYEKMALAEYLEIRNLMKSVIRKKYFRV